MVHFESLHNAGKEKNMGLDLWCPIWWPLTHLIILTTDMVMSHLIVLTHLFAVIKMTVLTHLFALIQLTVLSNIDCNDPLEWLDGPDPIDSPCPN